MRITGEHDQDNVINLRKWKRLKEKTDKNSKSVALSLLKLATVRNGFHRTPCIATDSRYYDFERAFKFEPTPDQSRAINAIEVCISSMYICILPP